MGKPFLSGGKPNGTSFFNGTFQNIWIPPGVSLLIPSFYRNNWKITVTFVRTIPVLLDEIRNSFGDPKGFHFV